MHWRAAHLIVGALGLIVFVLTGQFLARTGVSELPDVERILFRSLHIYLLGASVGNVFIGYYMSPSTILGKFRSLASLGLLLSPAMLSVSFFIEGSAAVMERPIATYTLYIVFGSAAMLLTAEILQRFKSD